MLTAWFNQRDRAARDATYTVWKLLKSAPMKRADAADVIDKALFRVGKEINKILPYMSILSN